MNRFVRYLTAGESHGRALVGIIEGIPAGLGISEKEINLDLARRQMGHGRGGRMKIEKDSARILSGVRHGKTLGSPIALMIENRDWKNWQEKMSVTPVAAGKEGKKVDIPRPGHADLAGALKYGHDDLRNVLERASARETAMRVALGGIARKLLSEFKVQIVSHVQQIGQAHSDFSVAQLGGPEVEKKFELASIGERADASPVRCLDEKVSQAMVAIIDRAKAERDTVGGIFEVIAIGVPSGLGSHVHWDRKLDGRIAAGMMSIPAMKGVEIGLGLEAGKIPGSEVHDEIFHDSKADAIYRNRNSAGGLEGGITNGSPLVVRVGMKPISTLMRPLASFNLRTREAAEAHIERSDVCAVPAAAVIAEAVLALVLADAFIEKFGGDSIAELRTRYEGD